MIFRGSYGFPSCVAFSLNILPKYKDRLLKMVNEATPKGKITEEDIKRIQAVASTRILSYKEFFNTHIEPQIDAWKKLKML